MELKILRAIRNKFLGYDGCQCCFRTWSETLPHVTQYSESGGMYPLCKHCWSKLSVNKRLRYYKLTLDSWSGLDDPDLPIPSWEALQQVLLEEGMVNHRRTPIATRHASYTRLDDLDTNAPYGEI